MCSSVSTLLWEETMSPAVLKTLSDATLVAGIQRYFFAREDSSGRSTWAFHHCSGSSLRAKDPAACIFKNQEGLLFTPAGCKSKALSRAILLTIYT